MAMAGLYQRVLPQEKQLFIEAIENGNMEGFYRLISAFQTQSEPAYCGLASLSMVLNALAIDPRRKWKGGMREKVELATKFGIIYDQGKTIFKGDPAYVRAACEASLKRLVVDCIDLYYQHRIDTTILIEVTDGIANSNLYTILTRLHINKDDLH